jgi:SPP1 family predicted phage head-tail adaptor
MLIGKLRDRITFQVSTPSQDSLGEPIDSWANVGTNPTVWAQITVKPGGERYVSGGEQLQARLVHTIVIRYRTDLTIKMRALFGSRIFAIENVYDPNGMKKYTALECYEVQL